MAKAKDFKRGDFLADGGIVVGHSRYAAHGIEYAIWLNNAIAYRVYNEKIDYEILRNDPKALDASMLGVAIVHAEDAANAAKNELDKAIAKHAEAVSEVAVAKEKFAEFALGRMNQGALA